MIKLTKHDRELLEDEGWQIDCEFPFEISKGEARASLLAAEIILYWFRHLDVGC